MFCPALATVRRIVFPALAQIAMMSVVLAAEIGDARNDSKPRDLSPMLTAIVKDSDVPGMVAATVAGDRVVAIGAAGVRKRGATEPVTTSDLFHLGSCTKAMTATLVARLIREGKISWDAKVGDVFSDLNDTMHPKWRDVTIEELLSNRGGAPADLKATGLWSRLWLRQGTPTEQRMTLVKGVVSKEPEAEPGAKYIYSNAGFAIAGAMAEHVTGDSWEDLMRSRIFEPLGMKSAGFGAPGTLEQIDQPRGHKADGTAVGPGAWADNPSAIGPAGTVHAAIEDWAKFIAVHLQGRRGGTDFLPAEVFAKLHRPAVSKGSDDHYALGWSITERPWGGGRVLNHSGSNTMWYCVVWMAPDKDFAVLICTNQGGDKGATACDDAASEMIAAYLKDK